MRTDMLNQYGNMLTTGELSKALGVHINTIRRWSNTGQIKHYKIGPRKDRRFDKADIVEFLNSYLNLNNCPNLNN